MDVDTELPSDTLIGRKRPYDGLATFDSDSDTETETTMAAKSKLDSRSKLASRGRGSGLARAKAELKEKVAEAKEEAFERSLRSRAFKKNVSQAILNSEESASEAREDPAKMNTEELRESVAALQGIIDALASRTEVEETRKLRADNSRLRKEVDGLKAEIKAHRREFAERRTTVAVANEASNRSAWDSQTMEAFKANIMSSVGVMFNAHMAGLEERLLPAKVQRPPLAADKKRESMLQNAPTYAQAASRALPPKPAPAPKRAPPVAPLTPTAGSSNAAITPETIQPKRSKRGRRGKYFPFSWNHKHAAVVVTLQPEVEHKGVTYAQVLERAEQGVKLQDLGITGGLKVRRSATGAKVLELPRAQSDQADNLADQLRTVLDGVVSVVHPIKRVDIVARAGNCPTEMVRCGDVSRGPGYMGMAIVTCPIAAARKVSNAGRLLVGWSSTRVCVLEQRPLRCFKCMGLGHTNTVCPSKAERGGLCFRCGLDGHKSADCNEKLRCAVCADAGKPSGHAMGTRECNPPITKGKVVLGSQHKNVGRRQAEEETAMST
ncbi:uncharacterized protein LOC126780629 [Nymphalis io]|uniref:uncharacterized protein LOC126780629 n=1 Tax=Inachis io TaxID=171585 RepID=UPI002166FE22|nr:uncharacterized protein LOC126780629 [Nymphalis io]